MLYTLLLSMLYILLLWTLDNGCVVKTHTVNGTVVSCWLKSSQIRVCEILEGSIKRVCMCMCVCVCVCVCVCPCSMHRPIPGTVWESDCQ